MYTATDNINLIYKVLNDCFKNGWTDDDFQNGYFGLKGACEKYDANKNIAFSSFAYICIKNAIVAKRKVNKTWDKHNSLRVEEPINEDITFADIFASKYNLEEDVVTKIMYEDAIEVIKTLNERQITRLNKRFIDGMTYKAIAEEEHKSRQCVEFDIKRSLRLIRGVLENGRRETV